MLVEFLCLQCIINHTHHFWQERAAIASSNKPSHRLEPFQTCQQNTTGFRQRLSPCLTCCLPANLSQSSTYPNNKILWIVLQVQLLDLVCITDCASRDFPLHQRCSAVQAGAKYRVCAPRTCRTYHFSLTFAEMVVEHPNPWNYKATDRSQQGKNFRSRRTRPRRRASLELCLKFHAAATFRKVVACRQKFYCLCIYF